MNIFHLPWYLLLPAIISLLILAYIFFKRRAIFKGPKINWIWLTITIFFGSYFLILFSVLYIDIMADINLQRFDLDKNGVFNGAEITPEMKTAQNIVIADNARNYAFITGLVYSSIITCGFLIITLVFSFIKIQINKARSI